MRFNQLQERVVSWADQKGILSKATPMTQHGKTQEEVYELEEALGYQNEDKDAYINSKGVLCDTDYEIKDAIGDILVTLIIQSSLQGIDILDCLEQALNVIEKRTGKMVNGTFVKDE